MSEVARIFDEGFIEGLWSGLVRGLGFPVSKAEARQVWHGLISVETLREKHERMKASEV